MRVINKELTVSAYANSKETTSQFISPYFFSWEDNCKVNL